MDFYNDHESSTEMSVDEDESDTDFLNEDEWASYRKIFDSFMMKVYKDTYREVMATDEDEVAYNIETDDGEAGDKGYIFDEEVLELASKAFRKRLINMMIIAYGLPRDERYGRLNPHRYA